MSRESVETRIAITRRRLAAAITYVGECELALGCAQQDVAFLTARVREEEAELAMGTTP